MSKKLDISGQKYGRLTALEKSGKDRFGSSLWRCKCDCGNETIVLLCNLRRGYTKSCGCLLKEIQNNKTRARIKLKLKIKESKIKIRFAKYDLSGKKFNRLTVLCLGGEMKNGRNKWLCRCDCGEETIVCTGNLKNGSVKSCGCIQKEAMRKIGTKTAENLSGRRFGRLLVVKRATGDFEKPRWKCLCDCGKEIIVRAHSLKNKFTRSCGCLFSDALKESNKRKFNDISGTKFGRLLVIKFVERKNCENMFECRCDCGEIVKVSAHSLRRGATKSCGCLQKEIVSKISMQRRGSKCYNWNPNLTDEERKHRRNNQGQKKWKTACLRRDGFKCQITGKNNNLVVHHLDGYDWCKDKRSLKENGITITNNIHCLFHKKYGYKNCTKEMFTEFAKLYKSESEEWYNVVSL